LALKCYAEAFSCSLQISIADIRTTGQTQAQLAVRNGGSQFIPLLLMLCHSLQANYLLLINKFMENYRACSTWPKSAKSFLTAVHQNRPPPQCKHAPKCLVIYRSVHWRQAVGNIVASANQFIVNCINFHTERTNRKPHGFTQGNA